MQRIGNDEAGYIVDVDATKNLVRIVGWGFWSGDVARDFGAKAVEACRYAPRGANVVMDMARLKPMRDEGQRAFGQVVASLKDFRMGQISVITSSHLTKLQLMRIAREVAPTHKLQFTESSEGEQYGNG